MPKKKVVEVIVKLRVPAWMTPSEARREVRTLINEQCNFMAYGPGYADVCVRAASVKSAKRSAK